MCRQLIANKKGILLIEEEYQGLLNYLVFLENERGGNGCGFLLVKNGKIFKFCKGLDKPSLSDIANILLTQDYDYVLFHTRLATIGSLQRYNCHPFVLKEDLAISMNGTEQAYMQKHYAYDTTYTDSQRIAFDFLKSGQDPKTFFLYNFKSVFMGIYNGKPFVASNFEQNIKLLTTGDVANLKSDDPIIFASDFPWQYDGKNIYNIVDEYFYYDENEKKLQKHLKPAARGRQAILDGLRRQLPKYIDTKITLLSQNTGQSEESFYQMTLNQINILYNESRVRKIVKDKKK